MSKNKQNKKKEIPEIKSSELEVISPENKDMISVSDNNNAVDINREGVRVKKSGNLVVGNLNLILNPFKKRWKRDYQNNFWHLIADVFLFLIIIGLIVFIIITNTLFANHSVSLNISADKENLAGSLTSFEFNYKSHKELENVSVQVLLPENFLIESVYPNNFYNDNFQIFDLGNLDKNSSGKIKINGLVWGNLNDHQNITFIFNCSKCGKNGIPTSLSYNIEQKALESFLEIDKTVYVNSDFIGKLKLKNNTDNTIENIKINLGSDLIIKKSNFIIESNKIIIDKIEGREELEIEFTVTTEEEKEVCISPEFEVKILNNDLIFVGESKTLELKTPGLNVNIFRDAGIVDENNYLSYKLKYENKNIKTAKNIKINISSANPNFSISSLNIDDYSRGISISGNTIFIEDLLKDESGELTLNALFDRRKNISNQELSLKINLEYEIDNQIIKYTSYSNKNKVLTKTLVSADAYYYSPQGDQLGVGPLPPAVNMATNYWVFLEFSSLGNDLENFSLTAELPQNVYFSNNKRVLDGRLIYGEIGKRAVWELERVNGNNSKYRAIFEITLIPEESDLGKVVNLLENIKLTAKDTFTEKEIIQNLPNITTNLINDKLSSGKGVVTTIK